MIKNAEISYPLMEEFLSIQGEGYYVNKKAWFIRLGGCDVGCIWCDAKESWDASLHPLVSVATLIQNAVKSEAPICIITGGEPAMYNLNPLCEGLIKVGIKTHIETSGTHKIQGTLDWVCVSPKKFKTPIESELAKADELKIIVLNKHDIEWAQQFIPFLKKDCKLFLQPEWDKQDKALPIIKSYINDNPHWQLSEQVHKQLGIR